MVGEFSITSRGLLSPLEEGQRDRQFRRDHHLLRARVEVVTRALPRVTGTAPAIGLISLISEHGFAKHDLVLLTIFHRPKVTYLLVVPSRLWSDADARRRVFELKKQIKTNGLRCLVLAAGIFRRQPRLQNALTIAKAARIELTTTQSMRVELFVHENGGARLDECAALLPELEDPYGAVLSLVAHSRLEIDLSRPIGPYSSLVVPSVA